MTKTGADFSVRLPAKKHCGFTAISVGRGRKIPTSKEWSDLNSEGLRRCWNFAGNLTASAEGTGMDIQHSAIKELNDFLVSHEIPYVLIGGIALQLWGEPRYTQDVDLTVVLDMTRESELVHAIISHFAPRISDADVFALDNRVILVWSSSGCPIDISLGLPGYEEEVIARAVSADFSPEIQGIKVCTAEDLVVMKIVAGRPRDIDDVEGIIIRQHDALDYGYIRLKLNGFDELLEPSELLERFEAICLSVRSMATS